MRPQAQLFLRAQKKIPLWKSKQQTVAANSIDPYLPCDNALLTVGAAMAKRSYLP